MSPWQVELVSLAVALGEPETAIVLRAVFGWRYVDPSEQVMSELVDPHNPLAAAGRTCDVTAGGEVLTHWVTPAGEWSIVNLGTVEQFRDGMRRLADAARLDDDDRVAFFAELRKWVRNDNRPAAEHNDLI